MSAALATETARPILSVNNIEVIYDHVILVLKGVSLTVPRGGVVAILGANGAGKTTTLKAISNLLKAERGEVTKGSIEFEGERVDRYSPNELVRRGENEDVKEFYLGVAEGAKKSFRDVKHYKRRKRWLA